MAGNRTKLPVSGNITSHFGERDDPFGAGRKTHKGIDIDGRTGDAVYQRVGGTVTYAGSKGTYGNFVEVTSPDGTKYRYGHLSRIDVRKGSQVSADQVIGAVGSTGRSTGSHLHYEVIDGTGRQVNPENGTTPSNVPANSPPQGGLNPLSVSAQERLRNDLARDENFLPNYLNGFHNVAYHIRFFIVDPDTFASKLGNMGGMEAGQVIEVIDNAPTVVIAESGVTSGISIKSLVYENYPADANNAQNIKDIVLNLVEPLGTSLFDVIINACNTLGIVNYGDSPYFLEIRFNGYDEDGNPLGNVLADYSPNMSGGGKAPLYSNQGRWIYRIAITDVNTSVGIEGASHEISAQMGALSGQAGQDSRTVPESRSIAASTVGEFLSKFEEALNAIQLRRYASDLHKYKFVVESTDTTETDISSDPSTWSLITDQTKFTDQSMFKIDKAIPTVTIPADYAIEKVLTNLFANTAEGQKYFINGVTTQGEGLDDQPKPRRQIIMKSTMNVTYGDYRGRDYARTYVYKIKPYFNNHVIGDARQVDEAKMPVVQKGMVEELHRKGLFKKRFDYLYTGLNTEILSLDVKFNLAWAAVLPNVAGYGANRQQITTAAAFNPEVAKLVGDAQTLNDRLKQLGLSIEQNKRDQAKANSSLNGATPDAAKVNVLRKQSATLEAERTAVTKQLNDINPRVEKLAEQDQQQRIKSLPNRVLYAEDLTTEAPVPFEPRLISAVANAKDGMVGMTEPAHRDRSVFSAMLEQIAGHTASLMEVDISIRGDPYWLGTGNIEKEDTSPDTVFLNWDGGSVVFLLRMLYPFNYGGSEESNGGLNIRNYEDDPETRKDAFTGFYIAKSVTNTFQDGQFTQTIKALRHPMLEVAKVLGYDEAVGELDLRPPPGSGGESAAGSDNFTPTQPRATKADQKHVQQVLYKAFRDQGFTNEGALTLVAQIGRENDYNAQFLYGTHDELNVKRKNVGMISWAAGRGTAVMEYMTNQKLAVNGRIIPGDNSLRGMAAFVTKELRTNPQYAASNRVLRQEGLSYNQIEPTVSRNYIAWDRAGNGKLGKAGAQNALQKMGGYYLAAKQNNGAS